MKLNMDENAFRIGIEPNVTPTITNRHNPESQGVTVEFAEKNGIVFVYLTYEQAEELRKKLADMPEVGKSK